MIVQVPVPEVVTPMVLPLPMNPVQAAPVFVHVTALFALPVTTAVSD